MTSVQHFKTYCRFVEPAIGFDKAAFLSENRSEPFLHVFLAKSRDLITRFEEYKQYLPPEKLAAIAQKRYSDDQTDHLAANGLLHDLLKKYYIADPNEKWQIAYRKGKKPMLKYINSNENGDGIGNNDLIFNLSHSKGSVAVVIGNKGNLIGIDIEKIRPLADIDSVAAYLFSEAEIAFLQQSPQPLIDFYVLWTRREAFIKANGWGFSYLSQSSDNSFTDGRHNIIFTLPNNPSSGTTADIPPALIPIPAATPFEIVTLPLPFWEGYCLSVACEKQLPENFKVYGGF